MRMRARRILFDPKMGSNFSCLTERKADGQADFITAMPEIKRRVGRGVG
jgi:hypothetical protein